jgi:thiosulfate/3-mercaptopyruvate sulfurtransferase
MSSSSQNSLPPAIASWLAAQNNLDPTPTLILAARQARADVLTHLLATGTQLQVLDEYGNNALWAACYAEDIACIEVLLQAGIDINFQNTTGITALIYASSSGKTAVVAHLLAAGADFSLVSQDEFSALDLAANRECLKLLRSHEKAQVSQ